MMLLRVISAAAFALLPVAGSAQDDPSQALAERCSAEQNKELCETRQREALARFLPVANLISDGQYVMQSIALVQCLERAKDDFGTDYIELSDCYDAAVTSSCNGNEQCVANSTIAGIERHIQNGTRP